MIVMKENITNNINKVEATTPNPQPSTQLQYISQGKTVEAHIQNIENVCKAGVNWVQLRLKNISDLEYLNAAKKVRVICDTYGATFIINDNIGVAGESQADGVHLGLDDASPLDARKQLGEHVIIGGTCNTLDDCIKRANEKVDYIGLGPFQFTKTKEKLSPVLGFKGYAEIISTLKNENIHIPIIAIGGITLKDIPQLTATGLSGVAVSGLLSGKSKDQIVNVINEIKNKRNRE